MSQSDFGDLIATNPDGPALGQFLNLFRDALNSGHSGSARPTYAVAGMIWVKDVSPTRRDVLIYDGTEDVLVVALNPTTHAVLEVGGGYTQAQVNSAIAAHSGQTNNPHGVTAAQVGAPPTSRQITTGTGLTGGGSLAANRTIAADIASKAEAESGSSNTKLMTAQRVKEAIAALGYTPPPIFQFRYYRFTATTTNYGIGEWEVYTQAGQQGMKVSGVTASASYQHSGGSYNAVNAVDGSAGTMWWTLSAPGGAGAHWLQLDLGASPPIISSMRFRNMSDGTSWTFSDGIVKASNTGAFGGEEVTVFENISTAASSPANVG